MRTRRSQVETALGYGLPDETWAKVQELGLDDELYSIERVAGTIRALRSRGERSPRVRVSTVWSGAIADRAAALSFCFGGAAARHWHVVDFRRRCLPSGLLAERAMVPWLRRQFKREVRAEAVRRGIDTDEAERSIFWADDTRLVTLCYQSPPEGPDSDEWEDLEIQVVSGSTLFQLGSCSYLLSVEFGWSAHQATTFVLTGKIPFVVPIVGEYAPPTSVTASVATTRLMITVDPTVTPQELSEWYREARSAVVNPRRVQPLRAKHLNLAMFGADRPDGESWEQARRRWNAEFPDWSYPSDQGRNFHRDVLAAQKRLLHPAAYQR
jgi:hypothetical protein